LPDFSITDSLGNPVDISTVKWTSGSSLYSYLKSEALHLAVVPDFIKIKDKALTQAAPKPTSFKLSVQHDFQLGATTPEIDLTPGAEVDLIVNATPGSNLFDDDSFHLPVTVPTQTGYVGMSFQGSLDLGVGGSSGDLTFGIDGKSSITLEFVKAFQTGQSEPTLWDATAALLSDFVIPASVDDLKRLNPNDVCCVSGEGRLKVSGSVSVSMPVNPLASVNLPLGVGTLAVQDGAMAGLSASLTLSGSYQIRIQRLTGGIVRLSVLRESGTVFKTDLSASAGITADLGKTDLLAKLLGTIGKGTVDQKTLDGLTAEEVKTFTSTLKEGIDHSLQASVDLALSESTDDQTAFQYDIQPDLLSADSTNAVNRALKGDLSLLTALEESMQPDGTIAPGVKLLNSVFSKAKTAGFSLKVNLLGIVNLISSSKLIGKCEFLFEPASGDLTIRETAESDRIDAITDPYRRQDALRKAIFDAVLVTTTYVVGKAIVMPSLSCEAVHFATNQNTSNQTIADYTNWFVALNLMKRAERAALLSRSGRGGLSTCVVRAAFDNAGCEALFFDERGNLRAATGYLEIGRQALKALLDPADSPIDQFRRDFLDNDATWQKAVETGPSPQLRELIPLSSTDPRLAVVLNDVSGDLYDIVWWANSMQQAGQALQDTRTFLAGRDPVTLAEDPDFAGRRDALQKLMLKVVASSKVRFNEPWGTVCLYWAAGSRRSSGKITAGTLVLQRNAPAEAASVAGHQG
jgi:hypothetical protein